MTRRAATVCGKAWWCNSLAGALMKHREKITVSRLVEQAESTQSAALKAALCSASSPPIIRRSVTVSSLSASRVHLQAWGPGGSTFLLFFLLSLFWFNLFISIRSADWPAAPPATLYLSSLLSSAHLTVSLAYAINITAAEESNPPIT